MYQFPSPVALLLSGWKQSSTGAAVKSTTLRLSQHNCWPHFRNCHYFVNISFSVTEYRVWVLEHRVQQQFTAYLSILNRNFSADLSSHDNPVFKKEAKEVKILVSGDHEFL